jgi:hypothetical protein
VGKIFAEFGDCLEWRIPETISTMKIVDVDLSIRIRISWTVPYYWHITYS